MNEEIYKNHQESIRSWTKFFVDKLNPCENKEEILPEPPRIIPTKRLDIKNMWIEMREPNEKGTLRGEMFCETVDGEIYAPTLLSNRKLIMVFNKK